MNKATVLTHQDEQKAFEAWFKTSGNTASYDVTWSVWQARAALSHTSDRDAPFLPSWANYRQGVMDGRGDALEEAAKSAQPAESKIAAPDFVEVPPAPCQYSNDAASAWQNGWEAGHKAALKGEGK